MSGRDTGLSSAESVELLSPNKGRSSSPASPSLKAAPVPFKGRWLTPEYLLYIALVAWPMITAFVIVWDLSAVADPHVHRQLQPGWMLGRRVDLADGQYRFFRSELPLLTLAAVGFLAMSLTVRYLSNNSLSARLYFYALFSFCFLIFANGSCIVFMLAIVGVNYLIGSLGVSRWSGAGRLATLLTWVFNCVILLLNERYDGYRWSSLLGVGGLGGESWDSPRGSAATWLDGHRGLFPWFRLFNLVVLRMISFNLDRIWAAEGRLVLERDGVTIVTFEKHSAKCVEGCAGRGEAGACPWWREKAHHAPTAYNPLTYFVYLFYVPLHFAGPTITFNSFLSHIVSPQRTYSPWGLAKYILLKVVFIFLVLEIWLHSFYVFSFTNSSAFLSFSPVQMALVSYFTLVAIWLKFTALWRFFRGWALLDGVEPPENMQRCVSNNYSIQSFWRAWHRSFNRWLVRYIYVPLGGASGASQTTPSWFASYPRLWSVLRQSFNVFLTFSFVAFWHDRTMQLLTWGWLVALLFVPELSAAALFNSRSLRPLKAKWYFRHIQAFGAAISIFMMMVANLIGYSVGIHGTSSILSTMVNEGGVPLFAIVFTTFFSAAMLMFEFRNTGITVD